ncbi:MAG TPA: hypothetical protein VGI19_03990 [Candidatus Cybelea sp.]|jgi:hypothetical protein
MDDYVQHDSSEDSFLDGTEMIGTCRFCDRPLLLRPWDEPDCGVHLN